MWKSFVKELAEEYRESKFGTSWFVGFSIIAIMIILNAIMTVPFIKGIMGLFAIIWFIGYLTLKFLFWIMNIEV